MVNFLVNLGIILKIYFGLSKVYESSIPFCTTTCVAETPSLVLQKVSLYDVQRIASVMARGALY